MTKAQKQPKDVPDDLAVSQYMGSMSEIEEGLRDLAKNKNPSQPITQTCCRTVKARLNRALTFLVYGMI